MKRKIQSLIVCFIILCSGVLTLAQDIKSEEKYLQDIGRFMKAGNVDRAIQKNNEMITNYPKSIKAYSSMALIYSKKNELEKAITYCNKAISFKTQDLSAENRESLYQAHNVLANIYSKKRKFEKAISELKRAIELKSNADGAYYTMGILYSQTGNYNAARKAFNSVIKIGLNGESKGVLANYAKQALEKIKNR